LQIWKINGKLSEIMGKQNRAKDHVCLSLQLIRKITYDRILDFRQGLTILIDTFELDSDFRIALRV